MLSYSIRSDVSTHITWGSLGYPSPRFISPHLSGRYLNLPCRHTFFFVQEYMMYSINILCSWFLLISTVSTLAIKPSQTLINLLPGPSSTADAQVNGQANVTLGWSSKNGSNDLKIDCSAARYGRGLRYSSCANAISSFVQPFTGWVTIGPREDNQAYNYYLPWRWISGTPLQSSSCGVMY